MSESTNRADLEAYLDEALAPEEMAAIEAKLRASSSLRTELASVQSRRNSGEHSLAEIWRSARLTCLSREDLGKMLLGVLPDAEAEYARFHLEIVGCRLCQASLADLERQQSECGQQVEQRRRRYFETSVGRLRERPSSS